jgi:hypothetical protein
MLSQTVGYWKIVVRGAYAPRTIILQYLLLRLLLEQLRRHGYETQTVGTDMGADDSGDIDQ